MRISAEHKKFLLFDQALYPAFFNALFNGGITWLLFRSVESTGLWGEGGFAVDLLATAFLLPLITCLIVSPLVGRQVRNGKLQIIEVGIVWPLWKRAIFLGLAGFLFAGVPLVVLLSLLQSSESPVLLSQHYALYKAFWTALIAAVVTPVIAWWALQAASAERPGV